MGGPFARPELTKLISRQCNQVGASVRQHPLYFLLVLRNHSVGIYDEFLGSAAVKIFVTAWSVVKFDHFDIHGFGYLYLVIQDRLHKLAIVFHDWTLAGREGVRSGPAQADADAQPSHLRILVHATRIAGHV